MAYKAVLYLRVSGKKQVDGTSLETQEQRSRDLAAKHGAQVAGVFTDPGKSGKFYMARPELQRALAFVEQERARFFIVGEFSRTGRNVIVLNTIRERLKRADCRLLACDGFDFENTPVGNFTFTVYAGMVQFELEQTQERTTRGRRARAAEGICPSVQHCAYGFMLPTKADVKSGAFAEEQRGRFQVVEERAEVVRRVFADFVNGESMNGIARVLTNEGIPAPGGTGSTWWSATVRGILTNPIYDGRAQYDKTNHKSDESRLQQGKLPTYSVKADVPGQVKEHQMWSRE